MEKHFWTKIIGLVLAIVLSATVAHATSLQWTLDQTARDRTDGFTVYFTDGTTEYTKSFPKSETVVDDTNGVVQYSNIEDNLNLHPGIQYTFALTRYNADVESDRSNEVTWTCPTHSSPGGQSTGGCFISVISGWHND